ncbi:MAG TPA: dynamin family protein [Pilimelia sp.]|nr:dynamin family protein [Pilimelia sp.]
MSETLLSRTRALLVRAGQEIPDPAAQTLLSAALERLDEPLRVAIAGKVKAGKSTLLNAMVGEELAPTDAGECTRIVTWYRDGRAYRVILHLVGGGQVQRPFDRVSGAIRIDLGRPADQVDRLDVEVPSRRLRQHTLIDTPGIDSVSTEVSMRTLAFMEADSERSAQADAVIYLLRHMHGSDLRFLEAFQRDELVRGSPINAVGVLSRADEIGSCRLNAMEAAGRVAARYQADERLRALCPIVVPVSGLLGVAGATLREDEFRCLATIAGAPIADVVDLLLTADRFAASASPISVDVPTRRGVLARLGLFGVRLGIQLIRAGSVRSAEELARELTARSGLTRLNEIIEAQFVDRSRVLKARSALAALETVLRTGHHDAAGPLAAAAEEIRASAHEFVEVRILHLLRSGRLSGPAEQLTEMERLLGGSGTETAVRLGLPTGASAEQLVTAAEQALARWQRIAEHPLHGRELRTAARATARTCEGILAAVHSPGADG